MKICLVCEGVTSTDVTACASCGGRLLRIDEIHFPVRRGEEDAAHPLLGALIDGKYRVAGVLGRGGMGTVFRAVHEVSLVPTALKLLHPRLAGRVEYRAQFLSEARKAGRVVHEHTARILDVGETQDGSIYIAQELVPGNTLQEWLAGERWPPQMLVEILRQVCAALVAAHAVGLVHRDLTPRNVMVDVRQGALHVKVLDFGIARGVAERAGSVGDDSLFASPPYAAPEHLAGQAVDGRADLYGLGVIAYEVLCGRVPTPGSTSRDFAAATLAGELLPLSPREWTPKPLLRLVEHLLARQADDRPESAAEVLTSLEAIASPRNTRVRIGSLALLLAATILFGIAFRESPPTPFLRLVPGQALELSASMPRVTAVQALRSEALFPLCFDFGAFDARRLTAEVWQNNEAVWRQDLRPLVRDGSLVLDRPQPEYLTLVDNIASHSRYGPVYLKFVVAGSPPLAYAVLQLDDAPPRVGLSLQKAGPDGTVNADTNLHIEMNEDHPGTLELKVAQAGALRLLPLPVELRGAGS